MKRLAVDRIEIRKIDRQAIQRFVLRTFLQQSSDLIRYYLCTALYFIAAHTANQAALNAASQGQEFTLRFDRVSHSRFGAPNFLVALPVHFSAGNHCVNLWKFLTETGRHSAIPCAVIMYGVRCVYMTYIQYVICQQLRGQVLKMCHDMKWYWDRVPPFRSGLITSTNPRWG